MARELGDKLGPRLSRLIIGHHLALRRQLAPLEATISAAGTQKVIDRAGRETAEHYRDMIGQLLKAHPNPEPWLVDYLQQTASGDHQWRSVAGVMGLTGVTGGLSTILSNYLAPAVQILTAEKPELQIDQNAAASAAASGIIPVDYARRLAAEAGFNGEQFAILQAMAVNVPDFPTLTDLHHRGVLSLDDLMAWMARLGLPPELVGPLINTMPALISPADAALAVLRGNMSAAEGDAIAAANGYSPAAFQVLIGNTGEPPAMEEMLMLWRRGKISTARLDRAILQSRVRDEWIPEIHMLAVEPPTAAEVIAALVQGQLSEPEAARRYAESGGDPTYFKTAFDTAANAPAPVELAVMANRGIIPWDGKGPDATTWQQGFMEGRWKNKWMPAFRRLAEYHPPPREIATLVREAGLSQNEAMTLWEQAGLTPDMAHLYWKAAHYTRTSAVHHLAVSEIRQLYTDKAISRDEALKMLESVGWPAIDAEWLLDIADLQLARKFLESAISRIHSLYVAHKISKSTATGALAALDVKASQAEQLVKLWDLERADNVRALTAAQITDAWFYKLISASEAVALLEQDGYTARDAWLVLSIKAKGAVPGLPEPGA